MRDPAEYRNIVVKSQNGAVTLLGAIATVEESTRNSRSAAWFNGQPAVIINVTKQVDANVIETVDRIHALLPELKHWVPAGVKRFRQPVRRQVSVSMSISGTTPQRVRIAVFSRRRFRGSGASSSGVRWIVPALRPAAVQRCACGRSACPTR